MTKRAKKMDAPPPSRRTAAGRWHVCVWLVIGILVSVTLGIYWQGTQNDFVNYDDDLFVTSNPQVQNGLTLENIRWAFLHSVAGNWHPLTMMSHMLDCELFGIEPWGHHFTNILLHVFNGVLLFFLLCRLTGAVWRPAVVAALFSLHPLHVESVAWVAERKDVLSACFGFLSLLCYVRYATGFNMRNPKPRTWYFLSLSFFALGLMSKPMLVTWPFVLMLLDYWPLERFRSVLHIFTKHKALLWEKIPFLLLTLAMSIATFLAQKQEGAMQGNVAFSAGARCANAVISYGRYIGKLLWPADLAVFYPHPREWPLMNVLLVAALLLAVSIYFIARRKQQPFLIFGWLWFLGTLIPVIGFVQVGAQAMADRYTYIPSVGFFMLVVWGAGEWAGKSHARRWTLCAIAVLSIALCLPLTSRQIGYWQSTETLFRHTLAVTRNNYVTHYNFARALYESNRLDEAISELEAAIRIEPGFADAYNLLGATLHARGRLDDALAQFAQAVAMKTDDAEVHYNFGVALVDKGRIDEALTEFQRAIRLKPDYAEAHHGLGIALGLKGRIDEAILQFQRAIQLKPADSAARESLTRALQIKEAAGNR